MIGRPQHVRRGCHRRDRSRLYFLHNDVVEVVGATATVGAEKFQVAASRRGKGSIARREVDGPSIDLDRGTQIGVDNALNVSN